MKIAISLLNFRPGKVGGTETYLRNLLAGLPEVAAGHEMVLLLDRDLAASNPFPEYHYAVVPLSTKQVMAQRALEAFTPYRARRAEKVIERLSPDVLLFPQQAMFPKTVAAPTALVVHDLYHVYFPQYLSNLQKRYREAIYPYSLRRADRIIVISDYTGRTLRQCYRADPNKIVTVPHGFQAVSGGPADEPLEVAKPYLYYPAATLPHKNHLALMHSLAALRGLGEFRGRLVLTGLQTRYWAKLQDEIRRMQLEDMVVQLGYVSYDRVWRLYRHAEGIVFPSLFEGFGLPVLEAVAHGKKIIVSRLELFDELGVPRHFQIDFDDPRQLRQALAEPGPTVLTRPPWNWRQCAAATMNELLALVEASGRQTPADRKPLQLGPPDTAAGPPIHTLAQPAQTGREEPRIRRAA